MGKLPTYFPHNVFSFRLRALPTRPTPGAEMDLLKRSRHLYVTFTDYLRPSVKLVSRVQISIAPRARSTYFAIRSHFARVCCSKVSRLFLHNKGKYRGKSFNLKRLTRRRQEELRKTELRSRRVGLKSSRLTARGKFKGSR